MGTRHVCLVFPKYHNGGLCYTLIRCEGGLDLQSYRTKDLFFRDADEEPIGIPGEQERDLYPSRLTFNPYLLGDQDRGKVGSPV